MNKGDRVNLRGNTGTIYGVVGGTVIIVKWDKPYAHGNKYTYESATNLKEFSK